MSCSGGRGSRVVASRGPLPEVMFVNGLTAFAPGAVPVAEFKANALPAPADIAILSSAFKLSAAEDIGKREHLNDG